MVYNIAKVLLPVCLVAWSQGRLAVQALISREECMKEYLPKRLACYDTDGPCDPLPIPTESMSKTTLNEKGYGFDVLRATPTTRVYAVTENAYWFLVVMDFPPKESSRGLLRRNLKSLKSKKGQDEPAPAPSPKATLLQSSVPTIENKPSAGPASEGGMESDAPSDVPSQTPVMAETTLVSIAIIDMPEGSFVVRDATGATIGSTITDALDELVFEVEGLTLADIGKVEMIYSHSHMDHVGAGTIVKDHLTSSWGKTDVDVVAGAAVKQTFEELIELGIFSYRAPLPNILVTNKTIHQVGSSTSIHLHPVTAHQSYNQDMIIFIERDESAPAIMMFVDVVFPKWAPFFKFAVTTDLGAFLGIHDVLLNDYDLGDDGYYVGGHVTQVGNREDIEISKNLTTTVLDGVMKGLMSVDGAAVVQQYGIADPNSTNLGNSWLWFEKYTGAIVNICVKQAVEAFGCKLAGVDITIPSCCDIAQSFVRVDE